VERVAHGACLLRSELLLLSAMTQGCVCSSSQKVEQLTLVILDPHHVVVRQMRGESRLAVRSKVISVS
jgi:hypothetical protein